MIIESAEGDRLELFAIAECLGRHGWVPHRLGEHGSVTCEPCRIHEESRYRRVYGTTREAS